MTGALRSYLWNRSSYGDGGIFSALELEGVDFMLSVNNLLIT